MYIMQRFIDARDRRGLPSIYDGADGGYGYLERSPLHAVVPITYMREVGNFRHCS
jgi:hypothetical protein